MRDSGLFRRCYKPTTRNSALKAVSAQFELPFPAGEGISLPLS
jgi:hypothetical protein